VQSIAILLLCWLIVFVMNIVPAFMPPTWSVLAYFRIVHGLPLLPLTIGGAAMSALGRVQLAHLSGRLGRFLPAKDQANAAALAAYITAHPNWRDGITFAYSLGPLPSNQLFIAAGIAKIPLRRMATVFFVSRAIGDTFWVWTAGNVAGNLGDIFSKGIGNWRSVALQVASLLLVAVLFHLPWARWLGLPVAKPASPDGKATSGSRDEQAFVQPVNGRLPEAGEDGCMERRSSPPVAEGGVHDPTAGIRLATISDESHPERGMR
jgi:hypothetical protein